MSVLFCFVLRCFILVCFVLFCFVLFCFVLFSFVLFCFLFCFVFFCFALFYSCFVCFVLLFRFVLDCFILVLFVLVCYSLDFLRFADTIPGNGRRDFRFIYCASVNCLEPVFWFARTLKPQSDGSYFAQRGKPVLGWSGFLIQLDYDIETDRNLTFSFRISSEVNIVPDEFPFSPCPAKICDNPPKVD